MNELQDVLKNYKKVTYPGIQPNRFLISDKGEIYDIINGKYISQSTDKDGYFIWHYNNTSFRVHRLVAWEYCPNRNLDLVIDHIDGNKQNNYYKNLEWVTSGENARRAIAMGLRNNRGENSSTNKYPEEFVHDICRLLAKGNCIMDIFYKVTERDPLIKKIDMSDPKDKSLYILIYHLSRKEIWPDVVSQYEFPEIPKSKKVFNPIEGKSRFTVDQVHQICKLYVAGKTTDEIIKTLGVDISDPKELKRYQDACRSIRSGRNWPNIGSQYFELTFRKTGRVIHKFDDDKLCDMLNRNCTRQEIYKEFNPTNDRLTKRALCKKIHNYAIMKGINN